MGVEGGRERERDSKKEREQESREAEIKRNNVVPYCVFRYYTSKPCTQWAWDLPHINQCSRTGAVELVHFILIWPELIFNWLLVQATARKAELFISGCWPARRKGTRATGPGTADDEELTCVSGCYRTCSIKAVAETVTACGGFVKTRKPLCMSSQRNAGILALTSRGFVPHHQTGGPSVFFCSWEPCWNRPNPHNPPSSQHHTERTISLNVTNAMHWM